MKKFFKLIAFSSFALSFNASAAFVSINNTIIEDSISGTQWVKLTETKGMSINSARDMIATDERYQGFRVATSQEVLTLFNSYFKYTTINVSNAPHNVRDPISDYDANITHNAFGRTNASWQASYGYSIGDSSPVIIGSDINSGTSYFYQFSNRGLNETYSSGGVYLIKGSFNDIPAPGMFMFTLLPLLFINKKRAS